MSKNDLIMTDEQFSCLFYDIHGEMNNCLFEVLQNNKTAKQASWDFWQHLHGTLRRELSKKQLKYWKDKE